MTSQETIEHDLRMLIGDLQVQLIVVRAQFTELREQYQTAITARENVAQATEIPIKSNGAAKIMPPVTGFE